MNPFTKHPKDVGMNYFQHGWGAIKFGLALIATGFKVLVHAFLPFLFVQAGDRVVELNSWLLSVREGGRKD